MLYYVKYVGGAHPFPKNAASRLSPAQHNTHSETKQGTNPHKTTTQEKTDLVRWIYVTMSFHPQLMDLSNLTADDVEMVNIRVADYMTNVFAYKCNEELNMAIDYEGEESVYYAFELLGEIAMTELMEDQGVSAASELFIDYIDVSIFEQILNY